MSDNLTENRPPISIILSVYNDWKWLEMILAALRMQTRRDFEVIVADDGSDEPFCAHVEAVANGADNYPFPLIHVWHPDEGWRKNKILNAAIRASHGEYLIFLDGDCIPHPKLVEEHYDARTPGRVIAGRRVTLTQELSDRLSPALVSEGYLWSASHLLQLLWAGLTGRQHHIENSIRITSPQLRRFIKERRSGLVGCNFSLFRDDLYRVNGFDERYQAPATGEDTDLEMRLNKEGIYIRTLKHMITVYHKCHPTLPYSSPENAALLEENRRKDSGYTPYGILQETATETSESIQ